MTQHSSSPAVTPQEVVWATRLLWVDAVVGTADAFRVFLKEADVALLILTTVLTWSAVAIINVYLLKAKNWARWFALGLTVLSFVGLSEPDTRAFPGLAFFVLATAIEIGALYLVFSKPAASWFEHS